MDKEKEDMIAIGIDPGKNTGFAVWDCQKQEFIELISTGFWGCHRRVLHWQNQCRAAGRKLLVVVEDPSGNSPVWHGKGKSKAVQAKIAQRVGRNKQMADLLIEGIRKAGIPVRPVTPRQSKWDAERFRKISGWQGQTNEHKRDAGRLVVGMRAMPDRQYQRITEQLTKAQ